MKNPDLNHMSTCSIFSMTKNATVSLIKIGDYIRSSRQGLVVCLDESNADCLGRGSCSSIASCCWRGRSRWLLAHFLNPNFFLSTKTKDWANLNAPQTKDEQTKIPSNKTTGIPTFFSKTFSQKKKTNAEKDKQRKRKLNTQKPTAV